MPNGVVVRVHRKVRFANKAFVLFLSLTLIVALSGCSHFSSGFLSRFLAAQPPESPLFSPSSFSENKEAVQYTQRVTLYDGVLNDDFFTNKINDPFGQNEDNSEIKSEINSETKNETKAATKAETNTKKTFLAAWAVDDQTMRLVGLSPTGQRLMTLSYDGEQLTEDYSNLLEDPIPGQTVMSYVQLAHWPQASIEMGLQSSSWSVDFLSDRRVLNYRGHHVADIFLSTEANKPKKIMIVNYKMPLLLEVETLTMSNSQ